MFVWGCGEDASCLEAGFQEGVSSGRWDASHLWTFCFPLLMFSLFSKAQREDH